MGVGNPENGRENPRVVNQYYGDTPTFPQALQRSYAEKKKEAAKEKVRQLKGEIILERKIKR